MAPQSRRPAVDRRRFLAALPALTLAPRLAAQSAAPALPVRGLSQIVLTVSDVPRSLHFYQELFGMPIQARQGDTLFLRIGDGPQFLALRPAMAGERPGISGFGMGVENFAVDRVLTTLAAHGVTRAEGADIRALAPMTVRVVPRPGALVASGQPPSDVYAADPSGHVFQLHDPSYCGGAGATGADCRAAETPKKGVLAVHEMSHFTIGVADQAKSVAFYQALFGAPVQVRQGAAPAYGIGPGVHFLMFLGGGPGRGGAAPAPPRIDHACMAMRGFEPSAVTKALTGFGLKPLPQASREPLVTYISLRMPNRGGAEGGTPELYLTDPDGLAIQLQDVSYCGGAGFLGDVCPPA